MNRNKSSVKVQVGNGHPKIVGVPEQEPVEYRRRERRERAELFADAAECGSEFLYLITLPGVNLPPDEIRNATAGLYFPIKAMAEGLRKDLKDDAARK